MTNIFPTLHLFNASILSCTNFSNYHLTKIKLNKILSQAWAKIINTTDRPHLHHRVPWHGNRGQSCGPTDWQVCIVYAASFVCFVDDSLFVKPN